MTLYPLVNIEWYHVEKNGGDLWHSQGNGHRNSWLVPWKMVIFPSKMVIIHGYVSLPEGIYDIYGIIMGVSMGISRKLCHIEVRSMISMSYQSYLWDIYDIL
jgi:hypothetical protein